MGYEFIPINSDELAHHGIPGMKWGVRRYQNKDGSLTPRGKKRLEKEEARLKEEAAVLRNKRAVQNRVDKIEAKRRANEDLKRELEERKSGGKSGDGEGQKRRTLKDLSNEELQAAIDRVRLEKTYKELTYKPPEVSKGKKFIAETWDKTVYPALQQAGKDTLSKSLTKIGKDYLGLDDVDPVQKLKRQSEAMEYKVKIKDAQNKLAGKNTTGDKYEDAKREAEYYKNLNTAKQQKDQWERNVANDDKPKVEHKPESKPEVDRATDWKNQVDEIYGKKTTAYGEQKADDILAEMDRRGWDDYERIYGKK